jgi:uncharacterized membrane protein (DUF373 family)
MFLKYLIVVELYKNLHQLKEHQCEFNANLAY